VGSLLTCSRDGALIATGKQFEGISVWDAFTGRRVQWYPIAPPMLRGAEPFGGRFGGGGFNSPPQVVSLSFSPDRRLLAAGGAAGGIGFAGRNPTGVVRIWNLAGTEEPAIFAQMYPPTFVTFLPDSPRLLVVSEQDVSILDTARGEETQVWVTAMPSNTALAVAAITPDGRLLAAVQKRNYQPEWLRVWDVVTGEELYRIDLGGEALAFRPDGQVLAVFVDS
jgi:WD40 repeat protein